jgi:hypothetical protein
MRKTLILDVNDELAEFIDNQPGTVDPSTFMNELFHKDMQKNGFHLSSNTQQQMHDEVVKELELWADNNIPAAG